MTRIEFAASMMLRAAAWSQQETVDSRSGRGNLTVEMVSAMLTLAGLRRRAWPKDLLLPNDRPTSTRPARLLGVLCTAGYIEKTKITYGLTDKGRDFVNTILK